MHSKFSIFCHTQSSYVDAICRRLGKGRHHASILYAHWFRKGEILGLEKLIEPQAVSLVREMIELTDFSLPLCSGSQEEGETRKFLLKMKDGLETESVLIPMDAGMTLCLSSQVGCRMSCAFCQTGKMGLVRQMTAAEIVAQVFYARFCLQKPIRNLVFMGMGEPLDNFEQVMQSVKVLTDPFGFGLGLSRITISTSGCVDGIYRLIDEADPALNLAVSINAPSDEVRRKIMPVNCRWNMAELKNAMQAYSAHPRREILIGYVLWKGINDAISDAEALADYLEGLSVKVNLIPYNPQQRDRFAPPEPEAKEAFLAHLRLRGLRTLLRGTKGQKIMAACGQLGNSFQKTTD